MEEEKEFSNLIKSQIKLEKEIAEKLHDLEQRVDSIAARLLIREMQLDTKKHAEILNETLKAMDIQKPLWDFTIHIDADKRLVKKELQKHLVAEESMLQKIKAQAKKTDDEAIKLLLEHFAEDEKKHHKYIKTILKKAYEMDL